MRDSECAYESSSAGILHHEQFGVCHQSLRENWRGSCVRLMTFDKVSFCLKLRFAGCLSMLQ